MNEKEEPILTPENPSLPPEGAEAMFKEMYMTGRAMRTDETLQDFNTERETSWPLEWEELKQERGWGAQSPDAQMNQGGGVAVNNVENVSSGAQAKIVEYVERVKAGEALDSLDLPPSFRSAVEQGLVVGKKMDSEVGGSFIPPQYRGITSPEVLGEIWTIPEYMDPEKTRTEKERKERALQELREELSILKLTTEEQSLTDNEKIEELRTTLGAKTKEELTPNVLGVDERKKLSGWDASYELAKIAEGQGVDLTTLSREEYVAYAIQNSCAIEDNQLRMAPFQRTATSTPELISQRKLKKGEVSKDIEDSFARFSANIMMKAEGTDRYLTDRIKVRQGTRDSNSWLFFGINDGVEDGGAETFKSYISFKNINTLTPERFTEFMVALRDSDYQGDIKIFQDLIEQGPVLNDQVVMHGRSQKDAEAALLVAERFFGDDLAQKALGKDEVINGKNTSYSEVLAERIKQEVRGTPRKSV